MTETLTSADMLFDQTQLLNEPTTPVRNARIHTMQEDFQDQHRPPTPLSRTRRASFSAPAVLRINDANDYLISLSMDKMSLQDETSGLRKSVLIQRVLSSRLQYKEHSGELSPSLRMRKESKRMSPLTPSSPFLFGAHAYSTTSFLPEYSDDPLASVFQLESRFSSEDKHDDSDGEDSADDSSSSCSDNDNDEDEEENEEENEENDANADRKRGSHVLVSPLFSRQSAANITRRSPATTITTTTTTVVDMTSATQADLANEERVIEMNLDDEDSQTARQQNAAGGSSESPTSSASSSATSSPDPEQGEQLLAKGPFAASSALADARANTVYDLSSHSLLGPAPTSVLEQDLSNADLPLYSIGGKGFYRESASSANSGSAAVAHELEAAALAMMNESAQADGMSVFDQALFDSLSGPEASTGDVTEHSVLHTAHNGKNILILRRPKRPFDQDAPEDATVELASDVVAASHPELKRVRSNLDTPVL
ncbi:hypothetical protein CAOG_02610 [Capsaspora owczarzaki ATCC 30864]|uniref:Uncharacterized protein n=1 Tax=Capsaspora owczarzaki (strain ATCC 30864) TaxID=595528 RepID=A0A0D2U8T4_CAPO3|nr:hypothetical protein CAOG_02610 [Capsaspora owczarzaki ATCC 30864]KJE91481.1 hypothetical protein CAOG_002610 [Capsaspora owczarzaki ATCC 30864]|eukprot:XP_004349360.1 hypothetical protein CAOG_02610 [Capsaspora owczarzaki ATCC 30864]